MSTGNDQSTNVAAAIDTRSDAIAQAAWEALRINHANLDLRYGGNVQSVWRDHFAQRLSELSVALASGDNRLFGERLAWARSAMESRGLATDDMEYSIAALRSALGNTLDGPDNALAQACIDEAMQVVASDVKGLSESALDAGAPLDKLALQYIQAVVAGNVTQAMQLILDAAERDISVSDAYLKVLLPAQQEVGRLWHINALTVSEEHLVSHTTQRLMAALAATATRAPDNGYTVVAGSVMGNSHDIGIRAIAYLMELDGWRTIYLGSDIPRDELPAALDGFEADVLMLSVALTSQIPETRKTIEEIRAQGKHPVKILIGGNGLAGRGELWKDLGADGSARSANSALTKALQLAQQ